MAVVAVAVASAGCFPCYPLYEGQAAEESRLRHELHELPLRSNEDHARGLYAAYRLIDVRGCALRVERIDGGDETERRIVAIERRIGPAGNIEPTATSNPISLTQWKALDDCMTRALSPEGRRRQRHHELEEARMHLSVVDHYTPYVEVEVLKDGELRSFQSCCWDEAPEGECDTVGEAFLLAKSWAPRWFQQCGRKFYLP